ncbi:MAG TPA: hypothetical protein VFN35_15620 [Ktedonobacteraceae bacterium]|nr:hypothetical protein [Ktedonobacteraceae bacterium]
MSPFYSQEEVALAEQKLRAIYRICPAFRRRWQKEINTWWGGDDRFFNIYTVCNVFSRYVTNLFRKEKYARIENICILIESFMNDEVFDVFNAAATCFLENILNAQTYSIKDILRFLGPQSFAFCQAWLPEAFMTEIEAQALLNVMADICPSMVARWEGNRSYYLRENITTPYALFYELAQEVAQHLKLPEYNHARLFSQVEAWLNDERFGIKNATEDVLLEPLLDNMPITIGESWEALGPETRVYCQEYLRYRESMPRPYRFNRSGIHLV